MKSNFIFSNLNSQKAFL